MIKRFAISALRPGCLRRPGVRPSRSGRARLLRGRPVASAVRSRPHPGDGCRRALGGAAWQPGAKIRALAGAVGLRRRHGDRLCRGAGRPGPALRRTGDPRLRRGASASPPPSRLAVPAARRHGDGRLLRLFPRPRAWRRDRFGRRAVLRPRLRPFDRAAASCRHRDRPWPRPGLRRRSAGGWLTRAAGMAAALGGLCGWQIA